MVDLAKMYYLNKDYKKSFYWFQNAAGNGDLFSQASIGIMYSQGQGVEKSISNSLQCLKAASERGNNYAKGHLSWVILSTVQYILQSNS